MTGADQIRNSIIDKLLTISNSAYLTALYNIVNASAEKNDIIQLSEFQIRMLSMSDDDIENNRIISQDALDQTDLEWIKNL